ncbi:hypothetical protein EJB05_01722 [Eragrostis curvula]|uniref:Uncharacterized protein n=1 Tax=Eragrostis curvula TaxID=38414 RepID=A0A5J9WQA5_9POAL|nr:hypothetical protein EJB05_01722 [Eragrostis curvula]
MKEVPDAVRRKKDVIDKLPFGEHTNTAGNETNVVIRDFPASRGRKDAVAVRSGKENKAIATISGGKENLAPSTPWSKTPEYRRQYPAQYRAKKKAELSAIGVHSQSILTKSSSTSGEPHETLAESDILTPFMSKTSPGLHVVSNSPGSRKVNQGKDGSLTPMRDYSITVIDEENLESKIGTKGPEL